MANSEVSQTINKWLKERNEEKMIKAWDDNVALRFSMMELKELDNVGNRQDHYILHELVKFGKGRVVSHLIKEYGFDINVQRSRDKCSPLHLSVWHEHSKMEQCLLKLGADQQLANSKGEAYYDLKAMSRDEKPFGARLQGLSSLKDVLGAFEGELQKMSIMDKLICYHRLGKLLGSFDPQFCDWHVTDDTKDVLSQNAFGDLCQSILVDLHEQADSQAWLAIFSGLYMLPDDVLFDGVLQHVKGNDLPLNEFSGQQLSTVAWCVAKMPEGKRKKLASSFFEMLGDIFYATLATPV